MNNYHTPLALPRIFTLWPFSSVVYFRVGDSLLGNNYKVSFVLVFK